MNAYELADKLDWVCENHLVAIGDADFKATANMLRQQADRIAELEIYEEQMKKIKTRKDLIDFIKGDQA